MMTTNGHNGSPDTPHKNVNYELLSNTSNGSTTNEPFTFGTPHSSTHHHTGVPTRRGRLVKRSNGRSLINHKHLPPLGWLGYLSDGFTTMINARWYWVILIFTLMYIISWLLFGLAWWGIDSAYEAIRNDSCVEQLNGFSSAFLFSLETQVTIGYGHRVITQDCVLGMFLLIIQCIVGLLIDSFLLGLVFSKVTRPRNRRKTILFSQQACIRETNKGKRVLQFRIADIREKSSLVEAHVRVQVYWYKEEERGKRVLYQEDLEVGYDTGTDRIILLTPVIVTHVINESSPLVNLNEDNYLSQDIEIVIILEAIVESTGLTAQALWSYTERELMFGYQFQPMTYRRDNGGAWEADFNLISNVVPSPPCRHGDPHRHGDDTS